MDSCVSNIISVEELKELYKNISGDEATAEVSCSRRLFSDGVCVADLPATNKHEPLEALHGARIMARQVGVSLSVLLFYFELSVEFSVALQ